MQSAHASSGLGRDRFDLMVGGAARVTSRTAEIRHPYDGSLVASVSIAAAADVDAAIAAAATAFPGWAALPAHRRASLLERAAALVEERATLLSHAVTAELGKPIRDSEGEVRRSAGILRRAASEAVRFHGEIVQTDGYEGSEDRFAFTLRVPLGPIACIVPFNFPVSSVLHKVGPALAAGNTVVVKPATSTPIGALLLGEIFTDAGFPPGVVNVVAGPSAEIGESLVCDPRVAMVSFTGSVEAGLEVRRQAGYKRVQLELGGNSAVVVHDDADLAAAARVIAHQGTSCAGQVCLAIQRVYAQRNVFDRLLELLLAEFERLVVGDPFDRLTDVGPLVAEAEARRVVEWIEEARASGATIRAGGQRTGSVVQPALLTGTTPAMRIEKDELFGPAITLSAYDSFDEALDLVNGSAYGLQAGIFTQDIGLAFAAARRAEVGGLMINDGPRFRIDSMPYGGTKLSGLGREGTRYAMEEMSDIRVVVFKGVFPVENRDSF